MRREFGHDVDPSLGIVAVRAALAATMRRRKALAALQ